VYHDSPLTHSLSLSLSLSREEKRRKREEIKNRRPWYYVLNRVKHQLFFYFFFLFIKGAVRIVILNQVAKNELFKNCVFKKLRFENAKNCFFKSQAMIVFFFFFFFLNREF